MPKCIINACLSDTNCVSIMDNNWRACFGQWYQCEEKRWSQLKINSAQNSKNLVFFLITSHIFLIIRIHINLMGEVPLNRFFCAERLKQSSCTAVEPIEWNPKSIFSSLWNFCRNSWFTEYYLNFPLTCLAEAGAIFSTSS